MGKVFHYLQVLKLKKKWLSCWKDFAILRKPSKESCNFRKIACRKNLQGSIQIPSPKKVQQQFSNNLKSNNLKSQLIDTFL